MAITHDFVQGPVDGVGKKVDNVLVDTDKERQVAAIGGPDSGDKDSIASVLAAAPAGTEFGLVTRNIPSGTQPISVVGTLPVSGTVLVTNIDTVLSSRLKPADTLAGVTAVGSITNPVAVTSAGLTNLDVALSTRLKPADTLTGVTTVATVTTITNPVAVTVAALPLPANAAKETGGNLDSLVATLGVTTAAAIRTDESGTVASRLRALSVQLDSLIGVCKTTNDLLFMLVHVQGGLGEGTRLVDAALTGVANVN